MDALKPCPFCGCNDVTVEKVAGSDDTGWLVTCDRDARCGSILADTEAEAIAAWNHRPETERLVEALEAMLGMHGSDIEETAARNKARAALTAAKGTE